MALQGAEFMQPQSRKEESWEQPGEGPQPTSTDVTHPPGYTWASLVAKMAKNLPAMREN